MSRYGSSGGGNEVIVIAVDAPDPDNPALVVYVAKKIKALRRLGIEVAGILLTGRPVGPPYNKNKRGLDVPVPGNYNKPASRQIQELDARRFYAYLRREGIEDILVYDGGIANETSIPDEIHYKSEDFNDIQGDGRPGDHIHPLRDLVQKIGGRGVHWAAGGPLTGVALALYNYKHLVRQTRNLAAMYGDMGTANLMSGEQFNYLADREAGKFVLKTLEEIGIVPILVPTDTTKHGFDPENRNRKGTLEMDEYDYGRIFRSSRNGPVMRDIQDKWKKNVLVPMKQGEFMHDVAAGMALAQVLGIAPQIFTFTETQCVFFESEGKLRMHVEPPAEIRQAMGREGPMRTRSGGGSEGERFRVKVALIHPESRELYIQDAQQTFQG